MSRASTTPTPRTATGATGSRARQAHPGRAGGGDPDIQPRVEMVVNPGGRSGRRTAGRRRPAGPPGVQLFGEASRECGRHPFGTIAGAIETAVHSLLHPGPERTEQGRGWV